MVAIRLDDACPGMVLEQDVLVRLLPGGVPLTPAHLNLLRMWGVGEVCVRGVPGREEAVAPAPPEPDPVEVAVADLFRNAGPAHPALEALKALVIERRRRAAQEASHAARG